MSALWPHSNALELDSNGPVVGAKVIFYNENTTTPQTTYSDASLSTVSSVDGDGYLLTDSTGRWPTVFLNSTPGTYRERALSPTGAVVLFDNDSVSVSQAADYVPPDAGDTAVELLFRTGMVQPYYGTGTPPSGWVRMAGRTIGSATSGASERANADTEDLFLFLWAQDSNLSVSGGRGGSAASDWAANKTIALPDARSRTLVGLASMGNSAAAILADSLLDGGATNDTLGAKGGADDVTLDATMIPAHTHSLNTMAAPNHGHPYRVNTGGGHTSDGQGGLMMDNDNPTKANQVAFTGTPSDSEAEQIGGSGSLPLTGAMGSIGGGLAHTNLQPTMLLTFIIKL